MYFKGQKFLVAGISGSGESSARFLLARGAAVYLYDDMITPAVRAAMDKLIAAGAEEVTASLYQDAVMGCDVLVLSPGIPIDNALPVAFRRMGKLIIGEEELAAAYLRATAVAVTGTNGKTTTVSMINNMLTDCGKTSVACGNIGEPTLNLVEKLSFDDFAVIEISSFQLETLSNLRPHVAVVTNITEDHLNRHYNMENYVFLKSKLVCSLRESEYAVLNYDDERVRAFASVTKARVVYFSAKSKVEGAYVEGGEVYYMGKKLFACSKMSLAGEHNLYNALACAAVAGILGLDEQTVAQSICAFRGVKHRIETVCERGGVTYINDSKGTNVDATLKAVASLASSAVLLLGGKDKGYDYAPLFDGLKNSNVVHAVFYGENRYKLLDSALKSGFTAFSLCRKMEEAVMLARNCAQRGQCVLLSPASSSFDEFKNYEERGDSFARLVQAFPDD